MRDILCFPVEMYEDIFGFVRCIRRANASATRFDNGLKLLGNSSTSVLGCDHTSFIKFRIKNVTTKLRPDREERDYYALDTE